MELSSRLTILAASAPGGTARQYRVQCISHTSGEWRLHSSFASLESALQCVAALEKGGQKARLVRYAIAPAAA